MSHNSMGTSICFNCPYDHYNIGILGDAKLTFKLCSELVKERKKTNKENKQTNKQTNNKQQRNYNTSQGIGKEFTHQCQVISDNHPHPDEKCC